MTPQLHVHIVGRRADDAAWPGPVWGFEAAVPYDSEALARARGAALGVLEG
jgi:diadenosine tetraphosphate (Ap4A) HIT family hydrolase